MKEIIDLESRSSVNYPKISIEDSIKILEQQGYELIFSLYYKDNTFQTISIEGEDSLILIFETLLNRMKKLQSIRREDEAKTK